MEMSRHLLRIDRSASCAGRSAWRSWRSTGRDETTMQTSEVRGAVAAGMSTAAMLGLTADDAIVLTDSNRLVLRLMPCDSVARVAHIAHRAGAAFEVELARRLAQTDCP